MTVLDAFSLVSIPPEDEALREPVRQFLTKALRDTPASVRSRSWSGYDPDFSRALGEKGWLGLTLPTEYGGAGRSSYARFVVSEELLNFGAPVGCHWTADRQSGPLILKYGSEHQKRHYLPLICKGEAFFCIGMSEPAAGSDLASVRSHAISNKNGWLLNGHKIWTTNAQGCHYMIALIRTSGKSEDRQKGLSQLIVDLRSPGIEIHPITDLTGDHHFCEVFFKDVQLEPDALIGEEGKGWEQVMAELAFERSGPERFYSSIVLLDEWLAFLRSETEQCKASIRLAGKLLSQLVPIRALSLSITEKLARGESPSVEAALVKDLGTEVEQEIVATIADDLFARPAEQVPMELLKALNYVTQVGPTFSLRGGARDILRGMIARGLGLR